MKASQSLRRPNHWQDFETLCKKLWGEIWNCKEIQKNGRSGQSQKGVDVYGVPYGEDGYYGIQCKGKDEYTHKQFTEEEIGKEIEKAIQFQPPLKKLYFATTAVKDVVIEEFVRKLNLENKRNGLFEVHLFSWEDIVDLIDENKCTHDWFVKDQNFKTSHSVHVSFQNSSSEITITPNFKLPIKNYTTKDDPLFKLREQFAWYNKISAAAGIYSAMANYGPKINLSLSSLSFEIHNNGLEAIEEYKLLFSLNGKIQSIAKSNKIDDVPVISRAFRSSDLYLDKETFTGKFVPHHSILVSDDKARSDEFFIKPLPENQEIVIEWKFLSKNFKDEGILKVLVKPIIERDTKYIFVENQEEARIERGEIEDFLVTREEHNEIINNQSRE